MCYIREGCLVGDASNSSRCSRVVIGGEVAGNVGVRNRQNLSAPP